MLLFFRKIFTQNIQSAIENNYLKQFNNIINEKDSRLINDDDLVIICTGSQGESRAGLSRIVNGNHRNLNISSEDLVIFSSREIRGNEKQINEIKRDYEDWLSYIRS